MINKRVKQRVGLYFAKDYGMDYKEVWEFVKGVEVGDEYTLLTMLEDKFIRKK